MTHEQNYSPVVTLVDEDVVALVDEDVVALVDVEDSIPSSKAAGTQTEWHPPQ
jgi:hypothetical protein